MQVGPSTDILHHQASEGFAHVEEQTLEEIHDRIYGIAKPVADDGASRKEELALSLMKKLQPKFTYTDAMKALSRAFIMEHPDSTLDPKIIPKHCLMELVTPNEASAINDVFERAKKLKKTRAADTSNAKRPSRNSSSLLQRSPPARRRRRAGKHLKILACPWRLNGF